MFESIRLYFQVRKALKRKYEKHLEDSFLLLMKSRNNLPVPKQEYIKTIAGDVGPYCEWWTINDYPIRVDEARTIERSSSFEDLALHLTGDCNGAREAAKIRLEELDD